MKRLTFAAAAAGGILALGAAVYGGLALWKNHRQHTASVALPDEPLPKPAIVTVVSTPSTPKAGTSEATPSETPDDGATPGPRARALVDPKKPEPRPEKPTSRPPRLAIAKPADRASTEPAKTVAPDEAPPPKDEGELTIKTALGATALSPWAKIFVDGTWVNGQSPTWEGKLPVGTHKVRVEPPCCIAEEREIEVKAGQQNPPLIVRLTPKPALLTVNSPVDDVEVWIGNVKRGVARDSQKDPFTVPLPEGAVRGKVTLRFFREGYQDLSRVESFEAGKHTAITVEMTEKK